MLGWLKMLFFCAPLFTLCIQNIFFVSSRELESHQVDNRIISKNLSMYVSTQGARSEASIMNSREVEVNVWKVSSHAIKFFYSSKTHKQPAVETTSFEVSWTARRSRREQIILTLTSEQKQNSKLAREESSGSCQIMSRLVCVSIEHVLWKV